MSDLTTGDGRQKPLYKIAPEIAGFKTNTYRRGYGYITPGQYVALKHLEQCRLDGWPFVALPEVHGKTIAALEQRDWIVADSSSGERRFKITWRGRQALSAFSQSKYRKDGLCSACGERPKRGGHASRCVECERDYQRDYYHNVKKKRAYRKRLAPCVT